MRKIIFGFIFFGCIHNTKAQYVTIPDSNFRAQLQSMVPGCFNANNMLDTTCTELSTVTSISLPILAFDPNVDIDGVQYFKSLQSFQANTLSYIYNISELPNSVNSITLEETGAVNWTKYPTSLTYLFILAGGINDLPLPLPQSLTEFDFINNENVQTIMPLPSKLQILNVNSIGLTSLPVLPPSLQQLDCSFNPDLHCLPELPASLTKLDIDTGIHCLPDTISGLNILIDQQPGPIPPVCNASNPNGCTLYKVCSWNGSVSTQWENPANWDCGYVPDNNTDVFINFGNVIVHSNATIKSLTENPDAHVTVDSSYTLTILQ